MLWNLWDESHVSQFRNLFSLASLVFSSSESILKILMHVIRFCVPRVSHKYTSLTRSCSVTSYRHSNQEEVGKRHSKIIKPRVISYRVIPETQKWWSFQRKRNVEFRWNQVWKQKLSLGQKEALSLELGYGIKKSSLGWLNPLDSLNLTL